ncbi:MAG: CoA transferase [Actinomycetota bacterium]
MKPLEGIRILEFSTMVTASFSAMMLAEQGAEVIKVEPIVMGDPMRLLGSMKGGVSALFANCNRGKRSLRVDLKSESGRQAIERLAADTDVVLCNFRPGVMDGVGLGSAQLRAINPRLIYAAVSGFGTEGPESGAPAYDPVIQAQSGFAAVQGQGQDGPELVRNLTCDKITAYTACQAVTAALFARERTGEGQHIDISMMDAGLFFLFPDGFMHRTLLDDDVDHGAPLSEMLYDLNKTKDGALTVSASSEGQLVGLLTALGQLHLFADERFNSRERLFANIEAFRQALEGAYADFETEQLYDELRANDVPVARCLDYDEVLAHPQYAANGSVKTAEHPVMGSMVQVASPARFGGEQLEPAEHAAEHGQHTEEILAEIGFSVDEIAGMVERDEARGITD